MNFLTVNEKDLCENIFTPLNVVFTLVRGDKGYMLVQNRESDYWELPAGRVEPEETFRECTIRRCKESSGQDAVNIEFVGLCKIVFENRNKSEYFAIFAAELEAELPYKSNDETKGMRWHKPGEELNPVCNTCMNIIGHYEKLRLR